MLKKNENKKLALKTLREQPTKSIDNINSCMRLGNLACR